MEQWNEKKSRVIEGGNKVGDFIQKINNWLLIVAQVVLFVMVFLVTADVIGRWLFSKPITGAVELTELGLSMVIFLSIGYTHLKEEHISIDFLVDQLSARAQTIINGIINIVIMIVLILMGLSLFWYTGRFYTSGTVTGDLNLPIHIFAGSATIGAFVFALTALFLAIKYFTRRSEK